MKPYFSYNGTLPYSPFNGVNSYLVFNIDNAISMSSSAFQSFSNIIAESTSQINPVKNGLYYNEKGPTYFSPSGKSEEIYISCSPTGSSGEVLIENLVDMPNNFKIELIDVNGNLVFTEVLQSTKLKLDLPNGLYLMKLSTKENIYFKKIIIEK